MSTEIRNSYSITTVRMFIAVCTRNRRMLFDIYGLQITWEVNALTMSIERIQKFKF